MGAVFFLRRRQAAHFLPRAPPPPPLDAWAPSPHPRPLPTLTLSLARSSPSRAASPARPLTSHGKPWWLGFERHPSPTRVPPISARFVSRSLIRLSHRALSWGLGFERHRSLLPTSPSHQLRPSPCRHRRRSHPGQLARVCGMLVTGWTRPHLFLLLDRSAIYICMDEWWWFLHTVCLIV